MEGEIKLNEKVLPDDYPVYGNYLYVCDGKVVMCDIMQGTISHLKHDLRTHYKLEAKVITSCDIIGRRKILEQQDKELINK